jgi:hypothetical protein
MGVMERSWGFQKGKSWEVSRSSIRTLLAGMRLLGGNILEFVAR